MSDTDKIMRMAEMLARVSQANNKKICLGVEAGDTRVKR